MTAAEVLSVHRVERAQACRRCTEPIHRGQRAALVAGTGAVHLRCLLVHQAAETPEESAITPPPASPEPPQPPAPVVVDGDDETGQDPRDTDWWQR